MDVAVLERELLLRVFSAADKLTEKAWDVSDRISLESALRIVVEDFQKFRLLRAGAERAARASQYANVAGEL